MSLGSYYRIGAEVDTRAPIDPYTDLDKPKTQEQRNIQMITTLGEGQNHWTQDQFRDKAKAWIDQASVDTMIIEITSNGAKLHSVPFDTSTGGDSKLDDVVKAYEAEIGKPASYAWIGIVSKGAGIIHDQMFAAVVPLVQQTTVTNTVKVPVPVTQPPPVQKGGAVAAGLGLLSALGILLLVAKAH